MAYKPNLKGTYEISGDGGTTYERLFNITGFGISGGDRDIEESETLDEGTTVTVGPPKNKDVSITLEPNPRSAGYMIAHDAYVNEKKVTVRVKGEADVIEDNSDSDAKLAIAVTGTVTGAGVKFQTQTKWVVGRLITISSKEFVIEKITSETEMIVSPKPSTAIASSKEWELVDYATEYEFEADVLNAGNVDGSPGSPSTDTLNLKMTELSKLPKAVTS